MQINKCIYDDFLVVVFDTIHTFSYNTDNQYNRVSYRKLYRIDYMNVHIENANAFILSHHRANCHKQHFYLKQFVEKIS